MTDEILKKELKMTDFSGAIKEDLLDKLLKMHRADNRSSKLSLKRIGIEDLHYVAAAGDAKSSMQKDNNGGTFTYARDGASNY